MKLAFWKRKRSRRAAPAAVGAGPDPDYASADRDTEDEQSAARALRVRTRRRLIGACALLLAAVILVPMVLDPTPHAVPDTIPIDLPSDRTPFTPHLAPPPEAPPASDNTVAPPAAPGSAADAAAVAGDAPAAPPAGAAGAAAKPAPPAAPAASAGRKHAAADAAPGGHLFVQAGAMAHKSAAQDLAHRLAKSGLNPFVERTDTSEGVRFRVRLGPFATREEAERSRKRLRELGVDANIVGA